jgi:hypothetical protein
MHRNGKRSEPSIGRRLFARLLQLVESRSRRTENFGVVRHCAERAADRGFRRLALRLIGEIGEAGDRQIVATALNHGKQNEKHTDC